MASLEYYVYMLGDRGSNRRYIGCTNNLKRRIRQHRGDIVGGAKYTRSFKDAYYILYIGMFTKCHALSLENVMKKHCRKKRTLKGKLEVVDDLIDENGVLTWSRREEVLIDDPTIYLIDSATYR